MSNFKKLKRVVVKEELFELTGDLEKAILLNQFIYWSERIRDFDRFIEEEKILAEKAELEAVNIEYQNGWIYKDMEELKEEVMFNSSVTTIGRKLNDLRKNGWIDRRNNPNFKWDKRYQYRINLLKISQDLFNIGYVLQDYKVNITQLLKLPNNQNESSNIQNEYSSNQDNKMAKSPNIQNECSSIQNESSEVQNDGALSEITSETTLEITSINQRKENQDIKNNRLIDNKKESKEDIDRQIKDNGFKSYDSLIHDISLSEEYFEHPLSEWVSSVGQAISEMYYYNTTIRGIEFSRFDVIRKLQNLNADIIENTILKVIEASKRQKLKHEVAFIKSTLFNEIDTYPASIQAKINYDFNRDSPKIKKSKAISTRFHNFEQRSDDYSTEQIENIARKKREEYKRKNC